jgi:plasmid stabilization system protein ParE
MKIRLEDEADEELIQATVYLSEKSPNLAEDFLAAIAAARTQLQQFPQSGQKRSARAPAGC